MSSKCFCGSMKLKDEPETQSEAHLTLVWWWDPISTSLNTQAGNHAAHPHNPQTHHLNVPEAAAAQPAALGGASRAKTI